MGKKLTNLNQYIVVVVDIDEKWFVIFQHTINHLSFDYVRLPQSDFFFFYPTFFLPCYPLLNRSTHCIQGLSS